MLFDKAKEKAEELAAEAKDKFGQRSDDSETENKDLRDKAEEGIQNAKEKFGQ